MKIIMAGSTEVMVSDCDFEELSKFSWEINDKGYARRSERIKGTGKIKRIRMHRQILNAQTDQFVDHKDRNPLNNQRDNLRFCTKSQNSCNTSSRKNSSSKYLGVCWDKEKNKWRAQILQKKLGRFKIEEDAARAYDAAARELHGEFANLNFKDQMNL